MLRFRVAVLAVGLIVASGGLGGCTTGAAAIGKTTTLVWPGIGTGAEANVKIRPDRRYLRVSVQGRTIFLVLGYLDPNPDGSTTETWYSAEGEVLKLSGGRIAGTAGLATDWREVRFSMAPDWQNIGTAPSAYVRERDEMPGYRIGIRESISIRRIAPALNSALKDLDSADLQWFEEIATPLSAAASPLPPSRFALQTEGGRSTIVYGEQCLSNTLCLSWQRWPARQEIQTN